MIETKGTVTRVASERRPASSLSTLALTDLGNSERLIQRHGSDLRYCPDRGAWLVWDGQRWRVDDSDLTLTMRCAKETVRAIAGEANGLPDGVLRKAVYEHARRSESLPRISAMIRLAQFDPRVTVASSELDADPWLLNVRNGTVDLRTGELRQHTRGDLLTMASSITYDPAAPCPTWEKFLTRILPDRELRGFVQRSLGYALTGLVSEQVVFLLYGSGANGKSTLVESVRSILGDYAANVEFESFTSQHDGPREDLARLAGRRFVTAGEPEKGTQLALSVLKKMTGGDPITARHLYGNPFEFAPIGKIFLSFNNRPRVSAQDHGTWRRMRMIPFGETIPDREQDRSLPERLRAEAAGVLAWLVDGCRQWQERGLNPPALVVDATDDYRHDEDPLAAFITDRCRLGVNRRAAPKTLYLAYVSHSEESGIRKPLSTVAFAEQLRERGCIQRRSSQERWWAGISLNDGTDDERVAEIACPKCGQPAEQQGTFTTDDGQGRYWCAACQFMFWARVSEVQNG